ncbi:RluA family pseudouridine synthase [Campylobacter sp. MIT 21-1685]|uniref:pseudouridine synthase family protein n=1 Tax=unclassified Campylobacter TaxID=2593542 RepID=UPI00224A59A9|nr:MULTISPECIES: RluA family pseudouridine synthase [unclassified Campylobacter]MCX2682795.1 RluA family pseudouridine synthase [Campylobacter sp. MIT 21-1684]MCX2751059.1 RluA family pseudouridine synthase [Campylobacter sp. MIT 21-1682]MCX2807276.1 RluA family pseudouridine synthase [Campylobacter sp. MIT 21-1685]
MQEKAYKLLAFQERISHKKAKDMIDKGCVFSQGRKIILARTLMDKKSKFEVLQIKKAHILFEDNRILAINKPYNCISEDLEKLYKAKLLHRLDKQTSGVLVLCKDDAIRKKCIEEFREQRVFKSYIAVLDGVLAEQITINEPLLTMKIKGGAYTKVSKQGLQALSIITPLMVIGKKTLAKVVIQTGRTHQIRVHTAFIKHGIIGDEKYAKISARRMYLHSYEIRFLEYSFKAHLDETFSQMGFEIKNLDFKGI